MSTTTASQEITVSKAGFVATVTFSRPPNNHVSVPLMRDMADTLEALDQDPDVRAVVLASEGKPFCAGAVVASGAPRNFASSFANPVVAGFQARALSPRHGSARSMENRSSTGGFGIAPGVIR